MRASADLFDSTRAEPALGLPAADLRALGAATQVFVANYFGEGAHDGMHTSAVSRAVAAAVGGSCELVVSNNPKEWLPRLAAFVERHSEVVLAP